MSNKPSKTQIDCAFKYSDISFQTMLTDTIKSLINANENYQVYKVIDKGFYSCHQWSDNEHCCKCECYNKDRFICRDKYEVLYKFYTHPDLKEFNKNPILKVITRVFIKIVKEKYNLKENIQIPTEELKEFMLLTIHKFIDEEFNCELCDDFYYC